MCLSGGQWYLLKQLAVHYVLVKRTSAFQLFIGSCYHLPQLQQGFNAVMTSIGNESATHVVALSSIAFSRRSYRLLHKFLM